MRRPLTLCTVILILFSWSGALFSAPAPPQVAAKSAILIDALSGRIIYQKACHTRLAPASTTKMMTAIVATERGKLDQVITATKHASETPYTSMHLFIGEQVSLHDVLYAMLLRSANDAAVAIAENLGGSEAEFASMMNDKARSIGAMETHFVNPNGLPDPQHYSTAYDLAIIARYALRVPFIREVVRTKRYRVTRSLNHRDLSFINHNHMLWRYTGADGIKTGCTREAGGCLAASATRDGWRLIAVVLKSKQASKDSCALLDYGYKNFKLVAVAREDLPAATIQVRGGTARKVRLFPYSGLGVVLPVRSQGIAESKLRLYRASAPIRRGEKLGTLTGFVNGSEIGSVDLVAAKDVHRTLAATLWFVFRSLLEFCILILLGFVIYGRTIAKNTRRRRRRFSSRGRDSHSLRQGRR